MASAAARVVLGPLGIDHVHGLGHDVVDPVDLAPQDHRAVLDAQVLERRPAPGAQLGLLAEGSVAVRARDLDRVLHLAVQLAVPHHIALGVAVDAVHAALVVHVGRHDRGVVEVEAAVEQRVGRAGDVGPARRARRKLGETAEVQPDRGVSVVARRARVRGRGARHLVRARVARLALGDLAVRADRESVARVGHVTRRAALAAVVAVETNAPAHGAPLGPQVALHALLAGQVGVVGREARAREPVVEGRYLAQPLDVAGLGPALGHAEDRVDGALLLDQAHLVVAVGEVPGRGRVQARQHVLHGVVVAATAGAVRPRAGPSGCLKLPVGRGHASSAATRSSRSAARERGRGLHVGLQLAARLRRLRRGSRRKTRSASGCISSIPAWQLKQPADSRFRARASV